MNDLKVGDEVIYVGNNVGQATNERMMGKIGILKQITEDTCVVQWNDGQQGHFIVNIRRNYNFEVEI